MGRWMSDEVALQTYELIKKGMDKYGLTEKAACQRIGFSPTSIVWLRKRCLNIQSKEELSNGKEQTERQESWEETI